MTENEIREHFEKVGYKGRSIVDVWFQNWDKIRSDLERRHPTLSQKIETHIRWKTDTGKKVLAEVLTYIETKKREYQANFKLGSRDLLNLDLNEVLVDGKTINEYFYSNVKHASKYSDWVDLSGIPLRDTRISNAVICNAQLSNADFSNSVLQSITFVNCNLTSCNFENAHVTMLRFKGTGGVANSNWISASVNSIDISANQFGAFPEFTKIGYFQLINVALTGRVPYRAKYTDFSNCYLKVESEEDSAQVKSVKEYISWYQDTVNKYTYRSRNDSFLSKALRVVNNTFNAITTMNWSSLWSTVLTGCSLVILFSALFFFNKSLFVGIDSYQHSLNLSIHVFTTLGLSDIKPDLTKGNLGLWLVSAESILGYFWLALTVMVLGRNVFK